MPPHQIFISSTPPRPSTSQKPTTAAYDLSRFSRQPTSRQKETQFILKHGMRHHSYDPEKAPYPVSYDRNVVELESLDHQLAKHMTQNVSVVEFPDGPPQRSLDLGCGMGTWILDAAKAWPDCEFVGFDLVNVQIPLGVIDLSIAERITWVHGNFLTTKLPFEDDEFDHVHIRSIAAGVPENKWGVLFEEINRILRPGGAVEVQEEDLIFPTLPRWFTEPLRVKSQRAGSIHFPDGSQRSHLPTPPRTPNENIAAHDHALLELLFNSLFEHRFINLKPTAVLPIYFTTYFRQVKLGPALNFPMPTLAPLQPLPKQIVTSYPIDSQLPFMRPASFSFSSTVSSSSTTWTADSNDTSSSDEFHNPPSTSETHDNNDTPTPRRPPIPNENGSSDPDANTTPRHCFIFDNFQDSNVLHSPRFQEPIASVNGLSERSLAMHLYRGYQLVLACQEAMWEELKDRMWNRKEELKDYGWEDDEELEELQGRKKFERLIERYKGDMHARVSLWCSLSELGWPLPPREPLSKAELIEEERVHQAVMEERKHAKLEDLQTPCRSVRVIWGIKSDTELELGCP